VGSRDEHSGESLPRGSRGRWRALIESAVGLLGPIALGSAIFLSDFAIRGVPFTALVRSLVVLWVITSVVYACTLLAFRRPAIAAVSTTLVVIAAWSAGWALIVALISVLVWRLLRLGGRAVGWRWDIAASAARTTSLVLLVIVMIGAVPGMPTFNPERVAATEAPGPPIYFVLLDAYPRADALAEWGYDNEWFLEGLEARGFDVARDATSNYDRTQHSLTALFYMRHLVDIDELKDPPADIFGRLNLLTRLIAEGGPAMKYLREHGYQVMTVPSPVVDVTMWGAEVVDVGHLTDFEIHLISDTDAGRLLTTLLGTDWLAEQARRGVQAELDALVESQGPGRFIWTHVMSPHPPYVFGANGGIAKCFPGCRYWFPGDNATERLVDQVADVNVLTLAAIDRISSESIVVLFSDHGANLPGAPNRFGNLIAVRAPGHRDILPDNVTVTALFPLIFNAYFDANIPIPENRHYDGGPPGRRLELTRVDSGLGP
jgi:hypothetical protein